MIFNEHIVRTKLNEYAGSEKKKTVIMDDGFKYLLKFPDPIREKDKQLSYINNAISEYIACNIFASVGLPVQETMLGEYIDENGKVKIACACKDVRKPGEIMYEINKLELSSLDNTHARELSLQYMDSVFAKMADVVPEEKLKEFYYDMLVVDTLVGNTDRHNGNWAILESDTGFRISPVYDCGSSLAPLIDEQSMSKDTGEYCAMNTLSVLKDASGKRLKYCDFFGKAENLNKDIQKALKRVIPRINIDKIQRIIWDTPYISPSRKEFYFSYVQTTYERILLPALEKCFSSSPAEVNLSAKECFEFYKKAIEPLKHTAQYQKQEIGDTKYAYSCAGKNHILLYKNDEFLCMLSTRSNNDDTRGNIQKFVNLDIPFDISKKIVLPDEQNNDKS